DRLAVVGARAVDLADRGAGERLVVPLHEALVERALKLLLDQRADLAGRRARGGGAQRGHAGLERLAALLGPHPVDVAGPLPHLGGHPAELTEDPGRLVGAPAASVAAAEHRDPAARARTREPGEATETTGGELGVVGHRPPRCTAFGAALPRATRAA